jgi:hypothetical protein
MDEKKTMVLVEEAIQDEFDKIRMRIADDLRKVVGPPPKISPEDAASLLGVSCSSCYRWLGALWSKLYLPQIDQVPSIAAFIGHITALEDAWKDVLVGWHVDQNEDLKAVFYHPGLVDVIENSKLTFEEKVGRLTKKTIRVLASRVREKKAE